MKITIRKIRPIARKKTSRNTRSKQAKTNCRRRCHVLKIKKIKVRMINKSYTEINVAIPVMISQSLCPEETRGMSRVFVGGALKLASAYLIFALSFSSLLFIRATSAYFNVSDTIVGNSVQAGTLDFSLSSPTGDFVVQGGDEDSGDEDDSKGKGKGKGHDNDGGESGEIATREISIKNEGSMLFQYAPYIKGITDNSESCGGLALEARLGGEVKYSGNLANFNLESYPVMISGSGEDIWEFTVNLPASNSGHGKGHGKKHGDDDSGGNGLCQFEFVYEAWQTNLDPNQGFNLEREIQNSLSLNSSDDSDDDEGEDEKENHENVSALSSIAPMGISNDPLPSPEPSLEILPSPSPSPSPTPEPSLSPSPEPSIEPSPTSDPTPSSSPEPETQMTENLSGNPPQDPPPSDSPSGDSSKPEIKNEPPASAPTGSA